MVSGARALAARDLARKTLVALVVFATLLGALAVFGASPAYAQGYSEFIVTSKESGIKSDCEKVDPAVDACTFEDAVTDANADSDPSVIMFALESVDRGQSQVVDAGNAGGGPSLPEGKVIPLYYQTSIDGFSQGVPDLPAGTPPIAIPKASIWLWEASSLPNSGGDKSTIRGLMLPGLLPVRGNYSGVINLGNSEGARIEGNWLGIGKTPETANGSPSSVSCVGCSNAVIGGPDPEDRNVLSGNRDSGVHLDRASDVTISGNYIGLAPDGRAAGNGKTQPNGEESLDAIAGILIENSSGVTVGGTQPSDGNVISGSGPPNPQPFRQPDGHGVGIYDSSNIRLQHNYIGTNSTGTAAIPNTGHGVVLDSFTSDEGAKSTDIAVGTPGRGNLISGNGSVMPGSGEGVQVAIGQYGYSVAKIQGNRIGTTADGTGSIPNRSDGVGAYINYSQVTVGGSAPLAGNVIANSQTGFGVLVHGRKVSEVLPDAAEILGNSIYDNARHGISLTGRTYPLPNDEEAPPYDADLGENDWQNYPVLDRAASDGSQTTVSGELRTAAGTFRVEVFSSPSCDPSGNGEGKTFLGAFEAQSDVSEAIEFTKTLPTPVPEGDRAITATATNTLGTPGKTSEFSRCITPRVPGEPPVIQLTDPAATANEGYTVLYGYSLDDTDGPPATVTPDCGSGGELVSSEAGDPPNSFRCSFPDGDTTTTVSVAADDGYNADGTDTDSVDVKVSNVAPEVAAADTQEATAGQEANLDLGSFADPGTDGDWEVTVDWGDGSTDTIFTAASTGSLGQKPHTYATSGTKTVTVTVTEAGGSPSESETFQVDVNDPPPQLYDLYDQYTFVGQRQSFDLGYFEDTGTGSPWEVSVDWGDDSTVETFSGEEAYDYFDPYYYLEEKKHTYADSGTYTVTVTVTEGDEDPSSDTETFQVTVDALNNAPEAENDSYDVDEGETLDIAAPGVLDNDTDTDSLTATVVDEPTSGDLTLNSDGSFTYTPDADFSGEDSFTYKANDGTNDSNTATVTITVAQTTPPDTTAPTVSGTSPTAGATGVPPTVSPTATFSEEMYPNSLTTSTVNLSQQQWSRAKKKGKKKRWVWVLQQVSVSVNVSCDSSCKTVTLDPASDLAASANHQISITTGAKDKADNALAQSYSWTFTTGSS